MTDISGRITDEQSFSPVTNFVKLLLLPVVCLLLAGCSRKSSSTGSAPPPVPAAPQPVAADSAPGNDAAPAPPPVPGQPAAATEAKAEAPAPAVEAGSDYGTAMGKLQRFKKWVGLLMDGGPNEKAQVRRSYDQLSAAEKKEFENYCRSCAVKFP